MSPHSDGGQNRFDCARASTREGRGTLPCENDQAKPDLFSRLACSTKLSKILESGPPERRPFGSRPGLLRQGVLELVALRQNLASYRSHRRFCANFLNLSKFRLMSSSLILLAGGQSRNSSSSAAVFLAYSNRHSGEVKSSVQKRRTAQNIKERPAQMRPSR